MPHVGYVTLDQEMIDQIQRIFPEWGISMDSVDPLEAVLHPFSDSWDVLLLDLDVIEFSAKDVGQFVSAAAKRARSTIVFLPQRLLAQESGLRAEGVQVLRKPVTTGEISLVLGRMLKQHQPCPSA